MSTKMTIKSTNERIDSLEKKMDRILGLLEGNNEVVKTSEGSAKKDNYEVIYSAKENRQRVYDAMEKDGKKSFNVKMLNSNDYEYIDMPLEVKRIYVNVNYNKLLEYYNEN
jgi:hypothetical protein